MLIEATNLTKSIGAKHLFKDVAFTIVPGEKIALIGRNGYGKTTLLKMLSGEDHDFDGKITTRKGLRITLTKQEHLRGTTHSPLEYILKDVPHFYQYKKILDDYEQGLNTNTDQYLRTLEQFTEKRYFHVIDAILSTLADFNIPHDAAHQPLANLSGGEKRYVEMTRMMFSRSDLLLVDEPTNHMDYQGKDRFISWMKSLSQTVLVVTHDRDVLKHVTKIFELKNQKIEVFKGNYDHYIAQNATQTLSSVKLYSDQLNRLKEAKKRVEWGLQMRAKSKQWKIRYDHWLRDYEKIKAETVKPSFWIDQNSVEELDGKVVDSYQKFKEKNIRISVSGEGESGTELMLIRNLSLGYEEPVFEHLHFSMRNNDRVFIKGKNGAGKSTLVRTILALAHHQQPKALQLNGEIILGADLRIGEYEQEISDKYLELPLEEAIRLSYKEKKVIIEDRQVKSLLAQYLFDPIADGQQKIMFLSGGQKARFQLIKMFIGEPNLLILDEPTNHLDLPSIEELENALSKFEGGILYISHDTYFINRMGGKVVEI
ncbi:MAG TPA: ABC-F family ATP-binding cassette domain-containing protein [Vitreimonas sp.]|nr:ABC-F family ATP-binding cassette domain-containing protein [Vitreimonas sp.]